MFRILAITVTLLAASSASQADVYRWVDSNGTVQYSDRWVPGSVLVKTDKPRPASPSVSAAPPAAKPGADRASEILTAQRDQRTVQQDVAKSKAEQCKKATEAYQQAVQSRRIYKGDANGERQYLSDADADAYRLQLLNNRKQLCGS